MARRCSITKKEVMTGNNVSHANNRTRRRFLPNIQNVTFSSEVLGPVKMRISTKAVRTIEKKGGIDEFLKSTSVSRLTDEAAQLKRRFDKASARAAE